MAYGGGGGGPTEWGELVSGSAAEGITTTSRISTQCVLFLAEAVMPYEGTE